MQAEFVGPYDSETDRVFVGESFQVVRRVPHLSFQMGMGDARAYPPALLPLSEVARLYEHLGRLLAEAPY